jgi:hypothetical protein
MCLVPFIGAYAISVLVYFTQNGVIKPKRVKYDKKYFTSNLPAKHFSRKEYESFIAHVNRNSIRTRHY